MSIYLTIFTVLPFAMTTAAFPLTKVVRPHAVTIAYFLDDDIIIELGISKSELTSKFILNTLIRTRFVPKV